MGLGSALPAGCSDDSDSTPKIDATKAMLGQDIFRNDMFGDETLWTDTLMMNQVIQTAVDPTTALAVGLKVDADALPAEVVAGVMNGTVSLTSPATTVALLKLNAVVVVKGTVETVGGADTLTRVGIPARSAIRPSTIRSPPGSASASTGGQTAHGRQRDERDRRPGVLEAARAAGVPSCVGAYVVMAWLICIAINLVSMGMFDIAVRDLALAAGAFALGALEGALAESGVHNRSHRAATRASATATS